MKAGQYEHYERIFNRDPLLFRIVFQGWQRAWVDDQPSAEGLRKSEFVLSIYTYQKYKTSRSTLQRKIKEAINMGFFADTGRVSEKYDGAKVYSYIGNYYLPLNLKYQRETPLDVISSMRRGVFTAAI
jgi:hypothetical protein